MPIDLVDTRELFAIKAIQAVSGGEPQQAVVSLRD